MSSSDLDIIIVSLKVRCDIHGEMKFKYPTEKDKREGWVCHGYDGEGCCNVTIRQVHEIRHGRGFEKDSPLLPAKYCRWLHKPDMLVVNVKEENW